MSTQTSFQFDISKDQYGRRIVTMDVPGECVPKGRPRFTKTGHTYTPKKTKDYEGYLINCFKRVGIDPLEGPVNLTIYVYRKVLKSWSQKRKNLSIHGAEATTRPDVDNYVKSIMDAGNGILYNDDSQVTMLKVLKSHDHEAHVKIILKDIGRMDPVYWEENLKERLNNDK